MSSMKWNEDGTISVIPPRNPKKITGTKFAAILGSNPWSTAFEIWCGLTRTYEKPFEDSIYTVAGKTIEPKQADYMAEKYFWRKLVRPADVWGENYFDKTHGYFFGDNLLNGMWDYLFVDENMGTEAVLEMKTTKRAEDWVDDIPEYYALQAALYAFLLNCDDVIMVCTILDEKDYEHPENFKVTPENTFERTFKVSERYPDFQRTVKNVQKWWDAHVLTGISPAYDEKRDADILKVLRANNVNPDTDLQALIDEAEALQTKIEEVDAQKAEPEKRLKILKDMIKESAAGMFSEGTKEVIFTGSKYKWTTSRTVSYKVDEEKLKADGLLDKYKTKEQVTYRLTPKAKGDK